MTDTRKSTVDGVTLYESPRDEDCPECESELYERKRRPKQDRVSNVIRIHFECPECGWTKKTTRRNSE